MKYQVIDKHINTNKIKILAEFDTREEALKMIQDFFFADLERYDSYELTSLVQIKLEDGKVVDWETFSAMEEVSGYEYIFEDDSYDFDSHRYYVDEEEETYVMEIEDNIEAITELYDHIARDLSHVEDDYYNDTLTINTGRDGENYAWYLDDTHDVAINLNTFDIIGSDKTSELLRQKKYLAYINDSLVYECEDFGDHEQDCYNAINRNLKIWPDSIHPIKVKVEIDFDTIYTETLAYDYSRNEWITIK